MAGIVAHKGAPEAMLLAIGKVVLDATLMDALLASLISALRSWDSSEMGKYMLQEDTGRKIAELERLSDTDELKSMAAQCRQIWDDRNLIIHGVVAIEASKPFPENHEDFTWTAGRRNAGKEQSFSVSFVEDLQQRIANMNALLIEEAAKKGRHTSKA